MNLILLLAVLATVFAALVCAWADQTATRKHKSRLWKLGVTFLWGVEEALALPAALWRKFKYRRHQVCYGANIAEGTHTNTLSKLADAAITTRHLLHKHGSDANHVAVCGATDIPLGTIDDEVATADLSNSWLSVNLLGRGPTKRMVASEAMATVGVNVYAAASGKIALSGTVLLGTLLTTASADGDVVEVRDCVPILAGYKTGGGAVTQITSASTGVTLNKPCGQITTVALSTAAGAEEAFVLTNSMIAATDVVVVSTTYAGAGTPLVAVKGVAAGSCTVVITNLHASAALDALAVINFAVIKSAAA